MIDFTFQLSLTDFSISGDPSNPHTKLEHVGGINIANFNWDNATFDRIRFQNDKFSWQDLRDRKQGKWVLRFPRTSPVINQVWQALSESLFYGQLWHVSAERPLADSPVQLINVHTSDISNLEEIVQVFNVLDKKDIVEVHLQEPMNQRELIYQPEATPDVVLYSQIDVHKWYVNRTMLVELREKIITHQFVLNGGGVRIDNKLYAKSAAYILNRLEEVLRLNPVITDKNLGDVQAVINRELSYKQSATRGFLFFGFGGRDETTARLYREIMAVMNNPPQIRAVNLFEQRAYRS